MNKLNIFKKLTVFALALATICGFGLSTLSSTSLAEDKKATIKLYVVDDTKYASFYQTALIAKLESGDFNYAENDIFMGTTPPSGMLLTTGEFKIYKTGTTTEEQKAVLNGTAKALATANPDKNGCVTFANIPIEGTSSQYTIIQTKPADGYVLNEADKAHNFTLTDNGQIQQIFVTNTKTELDTTVTTPVIKEPTTPTTDTTKPTQTTPTTTRPATGVEDIFPYLSGIMAFFVLAGIFAYAIKMTNE